jgi:hypothetical protein
MTTIEISKELYKRLESVAKNENRSVDDLVESSLHEYISAHGVNQWDATEDMSVEHDPFLMIARAADTLGDRSVSGDIAERSREILSKDFPEYLADRTSEQKSEDDARQNSG